MSKKLTIEVSEKELALIYMWRAMAYGSLTEVVVRAREPVMVKAAVQRLDLERPEEFAAAIGLKQTTAPSSGIPLDFSRIDVKGNEGILAAVKRLGDQMEAELSK